LSASARPNQPLSPQVWCVDLAAAAPALLEAERVAPRLSAADRERASSFADRGIAEEWLAAHIALRLLLERAGVPCRGVAFTLSDRGKPSVAGMVADFSLSHAPDLALIGISRGGSIGVDIERLKQVRIDAPRRLRIEEAGRALIAAKPLPDAGGERFLQAWVRLEAVAKAQGCGIGRVLSGLGIVASRKSQPADGDALAALIAASDVRDLALRDGVFAAAAFAGGPSTEAVSWLPTTREGLQKLAS